MNTNEQTVLACDRQTITLVVCTTPKYAVTCCALYKLFLCARSSMKRTNDLNTVFIREACHPVRKFKDSFDLVFLILYVHLNTHTRKILTFLHKECCITVISRRRKESYLFVRLTKLHQVSGQPLARPAPIFCFGVSTTTSAILSRK